MLASCTYHLPAPLNLSCTTGAMHKKKSDLSERKMFENFFKKSGEWTIIRKWQAERGLGKTNKETKQNKQKQKVQERRFINYKKGKTNDTHDISDISSLPLGKWYQGMSSTCVVMKDGYIVRVDGPNG